MVNIPDHYEDYILIWTMCLWSRISCGVRKSIIRLRVGGGYVHVIYGSLLVERLCVGYERANKPTGYISPNRSGRSDYDRVIADLCTLN